MKVAFSLALACLTLFSSNAQSDSSKRVFESLSSTAPSTLIESKIEKLVHLPFVKCRKGGILRKVECEAQDLFGNIFKLEKITARLIHKIVGATEFGSRLSCYHNTSDNRFRCSDYQFYSEPTLRPISEKNTDLVSPSGDLHLHVFSTSGYLLFNSDLNSLRLIPFQGYEVPTRLTDDEIYFMNPDHNMKAGRVLRLDLHSEEIQNTWDLTKVSKESVVFTDGYFRHNPLPVWCRTRNANTPGIIIDCSLEDKKNPGAGNITMILNPTFKPLAFRATVFDKRKGEIVPAHFRSNENYLDGNFAVIKSVVSRGMFASTATARVNLETGEFTTEYSPFARDSWD